MTQTAATGSGSSGGSKVKEAAPKTEYLVLKKTEIPNSETTVRVAYVPLGKVEIASAEAARRKFAHDHGGGTYVAVPTRSFTPTVIKVETEPRISEKGTEGIF